jgi:ureidoglycolate lyase
MKTVQIEELSVEAFQPFGSYSMQVDPAAEKMGAPPVEFFRDMVQLDLGRAAVASFSTCRVEKRDPVIAACECHSVTGEGILPLDNDILIHVAPATHPRAGVPVDKIRVFRVPRGTMVTLRPGVWHMAPFTANDDPASVLIVLPERTYANDCTVVPMPDEDQLTIELPAGA